jgi:hypothetical protein
LSSGWSWEGAMLSDAQPETVKRIKADVMRPV